MIGEAWERAWQPRDRRPIWEWAADNVTLAPVLSVSGPFSIEESLHFEAPLLAFQSEEVREINILKPPRGGGSLVGDMCLLWTMGVDPASILHVHINDKIAKSYCETRFMPMAKSVGPIVEQFDKSDRHKTRGMEIIPSHGLPYICTGPAVGNLQARAFRVVLGDEIWDWPQGRLREAKARMLDFERLQRNKFIGISQGGVVGDDWSAQTASGTLHEWEVCCQKCRKHFVVEWEGRRSDGSIYGMRWDSVKDAENLQRSVSHAMETTRYECPHCGHAHMDSRRVKSFWNTNGRYKSDINGNPRKKTFWWDSLIIDSWAEQVEEWIVAQNAFDEGNDIPLRQLQQKRRAKHFDPDQSDRIFQLPAIEITTNDDGEWLTNQAQVFQTVDVQRDHFWVLIVAWGVGSELLILWAGKVYSWEEVAAKQDEYKIKDQCVFVDSGDGSRQAEIYYQCARHGHQSGARWHSWWALAGADRDQGFDVEEGKGRKKTKVKKAYSWPPQKGDPLIGQRDDDLRKEMRGKHCPVVRWSNRMIKGLVAKRRDELANNNPRTKMQAADWNEEFAKQLYSEKLSKFVNKQTGQTTWRWVRLGKRDNHLWDCFCMQHVAAAMAGILTAALPE